jgi:DNA-nicking Smr family endonuclease
VIKKDLSKSDLKDWDEYTKNPNDIFDKDHSQKHVFTKKRFVFDLHGYTIENANNKIKQIILSCYEKKYNEILLITGKGLHSKSKDDVYSSLNMNKLKNSIPDFIQNTPQINEYIKEVIKAEKEEGGEGAIIIKLIK